MSRMKIIKQSVLEYVSIKMLTLDHKTILQIQGANHEENTISSCDDVGYHIGSCCNSIM